MLKDLCIVAIIDSGCSRSHLYIYQRIVSVDGILMYVECFKLNFHCMIVVYLHYRKLVLRIIVVVLL